MTQTCRFTPTSLTYTSTKLSWNSLFWSEAPEFDAPPCPPVPFAPKFHQNSIETPPKTVYFEVIWMLDCLSSHSQLDRDSTAIFRHRHDSTTEMPPETAYFEVILLLDCNFSCHISSVEPTSSWSNHKPTETPQQTTHFEGSAHPSTCLYKYFAIITINRLCLCVSVLLLNKSKKGEKLNNEWVGAGQ